MTSVYRAGGDVGPVRAHTHITHTNNDLHSSTHTEDITIMNTDITTIEHVDEASSVVDDQGASVVAGADLGRAYSGDTAMRFAEESRWASAQIQNFAEIDEDGTWLPDFELTVEQWAENMTRAQLGACEPADVLDQMWKIQTALRYGNAKQSASLIGRVSLDIYPAEPGRPQDLLHPTAPLVVFLEVKRGSFLWDDGKCRAVAVWFEPNTDADGAPIDSTGGVLRPFRGRIYCDTRHLDGYQGVIERFSSVRDAAEACEELRQAVKLAGTPAPTQYTDDPLDEIAANADAEDRADQARRTAGRREKQFVERVTSPI